MPSASETTSPPTRESTSGPGASPPASIRASTIEASSAPIGSLTIASHLRNDAARRSSRVLRISGSTTVGPVTTVIAP